MTCFVDRPWVPRVECEPPLTALIVLGGDRLDPGIRKVETMESQSIAFRQSFYSAA